MSRRPQCSKSGSARWCGAARCLLPPSKIGQGGGRNAVPYQQCPPAPGSTVQHTTLARIDIHTAGSASSPWKRPHCGSWGGCCPLSAGRRRRGPSTWSSGCPPSSRAGLGREDSHSACLGSVHNKLLQCRRAMEHVSSQPYGKRPPPRVKFTASRQGLPLRARGASVVGSRGSIDENGGHGRRVRPVLRTQWVWRQVVRRGGLLPPGPHATCDGLTPAHQRALLTHPPPPRPHGPHGARTIARSALPPAPPPSPPTSSHASCDAMVMTDRASRSSSTGR